VGVRLAVEPGRGRTAVPVRSALAGTVLSVLAVTAALTFGANLLHLVNSPPLYGERWDAAIDVQFATISPAAAEHQFGHLPGIAGWTYGQHGIIAIAGHVTPAIGLAAGKGPLLSPTLLQGRPPDNENEIVLGTSTLRQIGRHVGQTVTVTVSGRTLRERIVGRAVFPNFGQGSFTLTDLGQGAETTAAVLKAQAVPYGAPPGFQFVLLSFTPGPNRPANTVSFQPSMTSSCQTIQQSTCVVTSPITPVARTSRPGLLASPAPRRPPGSRPARSSRPGKSTAEPHPCACRLVRPSRRRQSPRPPRADRMRPEFPSHQPFSDANWVFLMRGQGDRRPWAALGPVPGSQGRAALDGRGQLCAAIRRFPGRSGDGEYEVGC
jgi:hypothetical protein